MPSSAVAVITSRELPEPPYVATHGLTTDEIDVLNTALNGMCGGCYAEVAVMESGEQYAPILAEDWGDVWAFQVNRADDRLTLKDLRGDADFDGGYVETFGSIADITAALRRFLGVRPAD